MSVILSSLAVAAGIWMILTSYCPCSNDLDLTTSTSLYQRIQTMENSQELTLTSSAIRLRHTLTIAAWNATITGAAGGTTIYCPSGKTALRILTSSVHLKRLTFKNCQGRSPVVAKGSASVARLLKELIDDEEASPSKTEAELKRYHILGVHLTNCSFESNRLGWKDDDEDSLANRSPLEAEFCVMTLTECTFRGNIAPVSGGGLNVDHVLLTVQRSTFIDNTVGRSGGGINALDSGIFLQDVWFDGNVAGFEGGALDVFNSVLNIQDSVFRRNVAGRLSGGAISAKSQRISIQSSSFYRNRAGQHGGAIALHPRVDSLSIQSCTFDGNDASEDGGAVYSVAREALIQQSFFTRNFADNHGGAIRAPMGTVKLQASMINANTAGSKRSPFYACGGYPEKNTESFIENQLNYQRAAICVHGGLIDIQASIVTNNTFERA